MFIRPNGVAFMAVAGTSLFEQRWKPKPGDVVSFKHHGFLTGSKKPKLATLYRLRHDLTWDQVVENWVEKKPSVPPGNLFFPTDSYLTLKEQIIYTVRTKQMMQKLVYKPKGYWSDIQNVRSFFDAVAKEHGFSPHSLDGWKSIKLEDLRKVWRPHPTQNRNRANFLPFR